MLLLREAEKVCKDRAGASVPPAPGTGSPPRPGVLKEYMVSKSPANSHLRSCFCDRQVEDADPPSHEKR